MGMKQKKIFFFLKKKQNIFCFIPMKISPNLYGRMDGSKFWCFPWFPENSLLCVILRYTVYVRFVFVQVQREAVSFGLLQKLMTCAPLTTNFGNLFFGFFCHFGCVIFFTLNFRFACLALLSKKVNKLLRNISKTSLPKTTKNQLKTKLWKWDEKLLDTG